MPDELGFEDCIVSSKQAAAMLKVSVVWLRKLVKDGYIHKLDRDQYRAMDVIHGYVDWVRDDNRRSSKSASASRMQDVKTERLEFDLKVAKRDYLPKEDLIAAVDIMSAAIRDEFTGVGARVTRDPAMRNRIDDETNASFSRVTDTLRGARDVALAGGELVDDPEEDDAS